VKNHLPVYVNSNPKSWITVKVICNNFPLKFESELRLYAQKKKGVFLVDSAPGYAQAILFLMQSMD
jgi:hypothetical protein